MTVVRIRCSMYTVYTGMSTTLAMQITFGSHTQVFFSQYSILDMQALILGREASLSLEAAAY